ncbi:ribonuclease HII [Algibacter sp. L4_22]|uniref:ribonuclease HII n=1 Tax=Algibacter sp. L4_22 TaxID=2942477 RepID=UPI00201B6F77|nr:ribonuclease HII [Algibacter sp. L4_22]MCL5128999.1 ribonuclease HII [Algibacter sp. L4_22]
MRFFSITLLLFITLSCTNTKKKRTDLIDFIPENSQVIIKARNVESLQNSINNNELIQQFSKSKYYQNLESKFENLSVLKSNSPILICFSKEKNDSLNYTLITKYHDSLFITDSLPNYKEEILTLKNNSILQSTLNENVFFSTVIDSVFIASSSKKTIKNTFNDFTLNKEQQRIYKSTDEENLSIIIKADTNILKSLFIEDSIKLKTFTNYLALDTELSQNSLYFNGITKATDSTKSLINAFKNTVPQVNQIQDITPSNIDAFISFSFNDFKVFKNNLALFRKQDSIITSTPLFDEVNEVGVIYEEKNRAIILNSSDIIATKDALLAEQNITETYRDVSIYNFSNPDLFTKIFSPLISTNQAKLYCTLDHFFIFAEDSEMLQNIISNYQNKTTLSTRNYFKDIQNELSDAASILMVINSNSLENIIKKNITEDLNLNLEPYKTSALQFIYDNNFAHVNGIIKTNKAKAAEQSVSEEFNIKLDADLLNTPQFVTNHITKQKDIVVQDVKNNLYLISNSGKIQWKKQLKGPVLGKIEQIDIYKNGRLQLAFATPNRVYLLDRKGKDVTQFPIKFNDAITQPLSVFDYDKNKRYRLLVTQSENVLMYDTKGKVVKGFKFKSAQNTIISQPQHFRIGNKDYITIKTLDKLLILDRVGKTRVTPKTKLSFSAKPIYMYLSKFTTTTNKGDLISIDTKGNTTTKNINLSAQHNIATTSKTLVYQSENKLTIRNKTINLDYGNYADAEIFYLNNKIYVSVTDIQSQKTYLFDSQAKLLPNFPVYANSKIDFANSDKDQNLEFVTKGDSNSVLLYQIN